MSTFSFRGRRRLVHLIPACALLLWVAAQTGASAQVGSPLGETDTTLRRQAQQPEVGSPLGETDTTLRRQAQQPQHKPFIEPSESHDRTKVKAVVEAQPAQNGRWDTLPYVMPINPVHVALMHDGKVLVIAGSGNDPDNQTLQAAVCRPARPRSRPAAARCSSDRAAETPSCWPS
jgi:hypothetical protein